MVLGPRVEVNPIKGNAMNSNGDFGNETTYFAAKSIAVHAEVAVRVAQADQLWREW
jgi:hypothetical protein